MVPIPKTKPATWEKLRPVSLTDHFAKVAEGFMAKWLLQILKAQLTPINMGIEREFPQLTILSN